MIQFREAKLEAGKLIITPERQDLGKVMAFIRKKTDKLYVLEIKEYRKKRSLDANAKLWALLNELSVALRLPPEEIYQGYIPDVGGNFQIVPVLPKEIPQWERDWCRGHIGRMVDDLGPCRTEALKGYHNLKLYRGSNEYDTAQFSRLLDLVLQDCRQLGIETLSEREKSLLLEEWEKTKNAEGH